MAVINGQAIVWGNDKLTFYGGIVSGTHAAHQQSASVARDSNKVDIENAVGDISAQVFAARKRTLNVTVLPYHSNTTSTIATAETALNSWCVAAGGTAYVGDVLSDPAGTTTTVGIMADAYNIISATQNRTQNGAATVDLVLESFDDKEITSATS